MCDIPFQIRFSGDFGEGLEFVEVEDEDGVGISVGEWEEDGDEWLLKVGDER